LLLHKHCASQAQLTVCMFQKEKRCRFFSTPQTTDQSPKRVFFKKNHCTNRIRSSHRFTTNQHRKKKCPERTEVRLDCTKVQPREKRSRQWDEEEKPHKDRKFCCGPMSLFVHVAALRNVDTIQEFTDILALDSAFLLDVGRRLRNGVDVDAGQDKLIFNISRTLAFDTVV